MERERKCSADEYVRRDKENLEDKGERERKKVYRKVEGERRKENGKERKEKG
jgi:hypothetical protein